MKDHLYVVVVITGKPAHGTNCCEHPTDTKLSLHPKLRSDDNDDNTHTLRDCKKVKAL